MQLDILNRRVRIGDDDLHLTGLEQSLLYLLAANAGQIISRDQIMDSLWGVDYAAGSNVVDQHVRSLRSKLQNDWRKPRFIETIPGKGYRFMPTFA
jgi:DNA-binding response OmpR family regulator